jgi:hypothetical protein
MRNAMRVTAAIVAGCSVPCVSAVSGFAQSNTASRHVFAVEHSAVGAMRAYVESRTAFVAAPSLPSNLEAPRVYLGLLESMLQRSPTFQRQCLRIAHHPDLTVRLEANLLSRPSDVRARTQITRRGRKLTAVVQVLQLDDPEELVAHELEHIIEQLDGIDLAARAALDNSGVRRRRGDPPLFETTRATEVGKAVARELRAGG